MAYVSARDVWFAHEHGADSPFVCRAFNQYRIPAVFLHNELESDAPVRTDVYIINT